jgi:hypothetical protein
MTDQKQKESKKPTPKVEVIVIKNEKDFEKAIEKIYGSSGKENKGK